MLTEKQKLIEQMKELKSHLPKEKKEELAKILEFGEKYKKEGDEMEGKFWKNYERKHFLNLISQYGESEKEFIKKLPLEEKEILDSLKGKGREKFYKEYLQEIILYRGDPERSPFKDNENEIGWIGGDIYEIKEKIKNLKWIMQPGMEIYLSENYIGDEGAKALVEELKDIFQPGIEIDLRDNNIGDEGVQALAECWKESLQPGMKIVLWGNNIRDEGAKAIAESWKNSLQPGMEINLGLNRIGDEGVQALADARKNSLQPGMEIDLTYNDIGDCGAQAIIDNLKLKDGVKLDLNCNDISDKKKEELRAWEEDYKRKGINCEVLF